uniref:Uncharacterized protein n=1 Tax=Rhizophora mucronata TaxID=61149 RepID=A0A2P2P5E5_RHIMU
MAMATKKTGADWVVENQN